MVFSATSHAEQLVSIRGLRLAESEYISGIEIKTWAVFIRAVCTIPPGWEITAGKGIDPGGEVSGGAGGFVANLNSKQLPELDNLFLIDDPDPEYRPTPTTPPMFEGTVSIGTYGKPEAGEHDITLGAVNFVMTPANGCPPTKPRR